MMTFVRYLLTTVLFALAVLAVPSASLKAAIKSKSASVKLTMHCSSDPLVLHVGDAFEDDCAIESEGEIGTMSMDMDGLQSALQDSGNATLLYDVSLGDGRTATFERFIKVMPLMATITTNK